MLSSNQIQSSAVSEFTDSCVLIVDDSEAFVSLLDAFLSAEVSCRVVSCGEGRGVLDLARLHRPHLIVLDLVLPDLHGQEVCRLLAEHPETADIPVILMSGMAPSKDWTPGKNVERFMAKPFPMGSFVDVVRDLLAGGQKAA
jgi:CheY-like chemotaxis protein